LSIDRSRLHNLELNFDKLREAFSNTATLGEVEDLRDEVVDALDAVKQHRYAMIEKHDHNRKHSMEDFGVHITETHLENKENHGRGGTFSLKDRNSIIDEIAISRPDRGEIEQLVMTRVEPVAGSVNNLHMEVGEVSGSGAKDCSEGLERSDDNPN